MPMSGDMRLRQFILALVALASIYVGVTAQRGRDHAHAQAVGTLPARPELPVPAAKPQPKPKLLHVPGLKRPVSATPIVVKPRVQPRVHVHKTVAASRTPVAKRVHARPKRAVKARPGKITQVEVDNRSYADTPPPPLEPLQISNVQVSALTSSSARITWQTNVPTLEQTAFGLDAPTVWTPPSSAVLIDHVSTITGLEFSTTYTAYLHAADEWDYYLKNNVTRADLAKDIPTARPGRISFLTLTNHFYSRAAALPQGKGMYPVLFTIPDVIGFDLYPLQIWCRPAFGDVYDAQSELRSDTGGKPTFQWIEVAPMEQPCHKNLSLDPTPDTVRAEAWLSIAGGADGIGYFPNHWSDPIGAQIMQTNREIKALTQALLAPIAASSSDSPAVRVSARSLNGALYVIAVNTSSATVQARINVDGIAGRSATVLGEGSPAVGADDKGFSDTFGPLAARVYVIPPARWS